MFKAHSVVAMAKEFIADSLPVDAVVVDATAGNGHDTLFLAQQLKGKGKVYSFDIQKEALEQTAKLLKENMLHTNVKLIHDGHENIVNHIQEPLDAVMFNLGYLPGGDHSIVTKPESTVKALEGAVKLLKQGGKISVAVYIGHQGGLQELAAVEKFIAQLDTRMYWAIKIEFVNRTSAPVLFLIRKGGLGD